MSDKEYQTASDDEIYAFMTFLGISVLTETTLNDAYRRLIRVHHVDKGGDIGNNQALTRARRILKSCLDNKRFVPPRNGTPGSSPSKPRQSGTFDEHYEYANAEDSFEHYTKGFRPKQQNPKYYFKQTKFDKAFRQGWKHPEEPEDPINSDIGKARSRPKKYNNDYVYSDDDEFIPNDKQNFATKNEGEPRVIRGGLELRKPLNGIGLPDNYDELSKSDVKLEELKRDELQTNPRLQELYKLLSSFDSSPSFDTLMQRTKAFVYMDWAQSTQSDTTQYQNIALEPNRLGGVTITLPKFEEDELVDDRLTEGALIELYSVYEIGIRAKATVDTVDWELHRITVTFTNKTLGDQLINSGHRCNISMSPSRFIYRAFIRGITEIINKNMVDYVYPEPNFDEEYQEFSDVTEQRISDRINHEQSSGSILFNPQQERAIDTIVNNACGNYPFLLFGPPGTGKTATLVECIHRITKMGKDKRILVCTPSNMAADVIASALLQRDFIDKKYIFRMNSLSFEYKKRNKTLDGITCITKEGSTYCFGIPCLRNLQVFRIIITTLTCSTYLNLAGGLRGYFSHILIDESAQATEQETMLPIGGLAISGKTTVVLFGDPKQLGAVDKIAVLRDFGYSKSMMERLMNLPAYESGDHRLYVMLEQNYRTHGLILRPASRLFYKQKLISMKTDKRLYEMCGWSELPNPSFPVIFHSIRGSREIKSATGSYRNNYEQDLCIDYVKKIMKHNIEPHDIGIISPYKYQQIAVRDSLIKNKIHAVTVNSVEGFQGSERKSIIFLTSRTNSMGFLSCDKRLNTSITRAQQLLIILGDEGLLSQHIAWDRFIQYCRHHNGFKPSVLCGANENTNFGPPPGFPIYQILSAPPGFEKPVLNAIPTNIQGKVNTAYANTTEEMKAEYDVDDDHDFPFNKVNGVSEYNELEDEWVDARSEVENFEPEPYQRHNAYDDLEYNREHGFYENGHDQYWEESTRPPRGHAYANNYGYNGRLYDETHRHQYSASNDDNTADHDFYPSGYYYDEDDNAERNYETDHYPNYENGRYTALESDEVADPIVPLRNGHPTDSNYDQRNYDTDRHRHWESPSSQQPTKHNFYPYGGDSTDIQHDERDNGTDRFRFMSPTSSKPAEPDDFNKLAEDIMKKLNDRRSR